MPSPAATRPRCWAHRFALGRAQPFQPLCCRAQGRREAADAEPCERALDPIADARALTDQVLALAAGPLGVFLFQARDRGHAAVFALAAQPAEKGPFQQRRVEPIGLRPAMSRETAMLFGWIT